MQKNNTPIFPILKSEKLTLRGLHLSDVEEIFELRSNSEINKYLDRQPCNTIEDARNFIQMINENIYKNDAYYWAITLNDANKLIGTICLYSFSEKYNNCEIGYELHPNFQKKGIMKDAIHKVLDFAFTKIKVQQVNAEMHRNNQRSINLLKNLQFKQSVKPEDTCAELTYYHLNNTFFK